MEHGDVAELADALDLGSSSLRSAGSNPVIPITLKWPHSGLFGDEVMITW